MVLQFSHNFPQFPAIFPQFFYNWILSAPQTAIPPPPPLWRGRDRQGLQTPTCTRAALILKCFSHIS